MRLTACVFALFVSACGAASGLSPELGHEHQLAHAKPHTLVRRQAHPFGTDPINVALDTLLEIVNELPNKDLDTALRMHLLPPIVSLSKFVEDFSGERILNFVASINGKKVMDWLRNFDPSTLWMIFDKLQIEKFVMDKFGLNIAPVTKIFRPLKGADYVHMFESLTNDDMVNVAMIFLDLTGLPELLDGKVDVEVVVSGIIKFNGADVVRAFERFDGKKLLQTISSIDGPELIDLLNKTISQVLSLVREIVAVLNNGKPPEPYTAFDIVRALDAVTDTFNYLTGLQFPIMSQALKQFSGSKYLQQFKTLDLRVIIETIVNLRLAAITQFKKEVADGTYNLSTFQKLLLFIKDLNGTVIINFIENLHPAAFCEKLAKSPMIKLIKITTYIDLVPFLRTFSKFDGKVFLENFENWSNDQWLEFLNGVGVLDYLRGFTGIPIKPVIFVMQTFDGSVLLMTVKLFDGNDIYQALTA